MSAGGWGLDHGAWVPLRYLYPKADVLVFQVLLPVGLDGASAYAFGQALAPLADEGVLIVGSGSLTHNLGDVRFGDPNLETAPYVDAFAAWDERTLSSLDHGQLVRVLELAPLTGGPTRPPNTFGR